MTAPQTPGFRASTLAEARLMVNVVSAYEHVNLRLTQTHLSIDWPVTILGVVPTRRARLLSPLGEVRSIRLVRVAFPSRLSVVAFLALLPVVVDLPAAVVAPLVLLALVFLALSLVLAIEVVTAAGTFTIPVCWLQRRVASGFIQEVRLAARLDDRGDS